MNNQSKYGVNNNEHNLCRFKKKMGIPCEYQRYCTNSYPEETAQEQVWKTQTKFINLLALGQ